MKETMKSIMCPQCDFERAQNLENLKVENQRLRDEVNLLFYFCFLIKLFFLKQLPIYTRDKGLMI